MSNRSAREAAEMHKVRKLLAVQNAQVHAEGVAERFGAFSPEAGIALEVLREAKKELVAAYDRAIALDHPLAPGASS